MDTFQSLKVLVRRIMCSISTYALDFLTVYEMDTIYSDYHANRYLLILKAGK